MAVDMLVDSTALDAALTATANAIRTKGGTSAQIAFDDETGFAAAIAALPSGGGEAILENDVNFWDYDGKLVAAYSAADFANLAAMPDNPTHAGLTAQGWNWTLSDAKTHVASYGILDIGQSYVTNDNTTRLYCHFDKYTLSPCLRIYVNGTVSIDWGDSSTTDTLTGSSLSTQADVSHTYATAGDYVITLTATTGTFAFGGKCLSKSNTADSNESRLYLSCIYKVELGTNVSLNDSSFEHCTRMENITVPTAITSLPQYSFNDCPMLTMFVIPNTVSSLGRQLFGSCYDMLHIAIPKSVTSIGRATFESCDSLERITLSEYVTSLNISSFTTCHSLKRITMGGVTSGGGNSVFSGCTSLEKIVYPSGTTSFGTYTFSACENLKEVMLPDTLQSFGGYNFSGCSVLREITIPASVTTIAGNTFQNCYGLRELHFKPSSPPTVANANAFTNLPTDCKIYVPTGHLSDYTTASNYPSSLTYTYIEE